MHRMDDVRFLSPTLLLHSELFEVGLVSAEGNLKVETYSSLTESRQQNQQGSGLLGQCLKV